VSPNWPRNHKDIEKCTISVGIPFQKIWSKEFQTEMRCDKIWVHSQANSGLVGLSPPLKSGRSHKGQPARLLHSEVLVAAATIECSPWDDLTSARELICEDRFRAWDCT